MIPGLTASPKMYAGGRGGESRSKNTGGNIAVRSGIDGNANPHPAEHVIGLDAKASSASVRGFHLADVYDEVGAASLNCRQEAEGRRAQQRYRQGKHKHAESETDAFREGKVRGQPSKKSDTQRRQNDTQSSAQQRQQSALGE